MEFNCFGNLVTIELFAEMKIKLIKFDISEAHCGHVNKAILQRHKIATVIWISILDKSNNCSQSGCF